MKTVRECINEARAKNNDVCIETDEGFYGEVFGGGWSAEGEHGWHEEEHAFDDYTVVKVAELEEGITIITVEE